MAEMSHMTTCAFSHCSLGAPIQILNAPPQLKMPNSQPYNKLQCRDSGLVQRQLWNVRAHSALMLAARASLPHFSVSSLMNLPNSAGELGSAVPPSSASRVFIPGSTRPALISLLSLLTISADVFLG